MTLSFLLKCLRTQLLFSLSLGVLPALQSQSCLYLAYEGFDYAANTPLHALSGGSGWEEPWNVQGENQVLPGFQIGDTPMALGFLDLQTTGFYASGGKSYLTAGRRLDASANGPFSAYINPNSGSGIGTAESGDLYFSALLKKTPGNKEPVFVSLHGDQIPWYINNNHSHVEVGYFGTASDSLGVPRWCLRINGVIHNTLANLNPAFFVLRLRFKPGSTQLDLWLNPPVLGDLPSFPLMSRTVNTTFALRSFGLYLGDQAGSGQVDELRFADTYQCATPNTGINVNLPPKAAFTMSANSGTAPFTVNFDASASLDPEGSALTYEWDFGDGAPVESGLTTSHTYNALGLINVSLKVRDEAGLQQTTFQSLKVLDANGTFPCQSTFTVAQMPTCKGDNGRIQVHSSVPFSLRNSANILITPVNGSEYQQLAPGIYHFTASGGVGGCRDTFDLHLERDSSSCPNWQPDSCAMDIGTNLSGFADWGVERPMRNLFKHIRPEPIAYTTTCFCWDSQVLDEIQFDADGYPTHLPQTTSAGDNTVLRYVIASESPTGTNLQTGKQYVLLYDGDGSLKIDGPATVSSSTPGRIQFSINTNQANYALSILTSLAANPVRNIRLLRLEDEQADLQTQPFYNGFIEKIKPFKMLRFMDWGHTNNNPVQHWSDRTTLSRFTYAGEKGVPYEIMIQLANQLDKDVWICVPHQADAAYVEQMALLFKNQLKPKLRIYLEYSNEVWNWIFQQAHYNNDNRPSNLGYGRAYAEKAKNTFNIWHSVFGPEKGRVTRVLGIQTIYNGLNEEILSQLRQEDWDLGSPTHYVGLEHGNSGNPILNAASTPEDIIQNARNAWHTYIPAIKKDYALIRLMGKKIATYEGGQHFVGNVFGIPYPYQQAMWDAQYSPGIYHLYDAVLDSIRSWGCVLAGNFSLASPQASVYGSWGVLNDIDIQAPYLQNAPKYQALLDNICHPGVVSSIATPPGTSKELYLYPNPASDGVQIIAESDMRSLSLFSSLGQPLRTQNIGSRQAILDLKPLPSGAYWVRVDLGDKILWRKVVKE